MTRLFIGFITLCVGAMAAAGEISHTQLMQRLDALDARVKTDGDAIVAVSLKPSKPIDAEVWDALAKEPKLTAFTGTRFSGPDIRRIGGLKSLTRLTLGGGNYDDGDLKSWSNLKNLHRLHIHHNRGLSGDGFRQLSGCKNLEHITIHNVKPFKGKAIAHLAKLPNLKSLHLTAVRTDLNDLGPLEGHPTLEEVTYANKDFDGIVRFVATLPSLKKVELLRDKMAPIDDRLVAALAAKPNLEHIRAVNVGFTKAQYARLKRALPKLEIDMRKDDGGHTKSYPVKPL
ncbi:hypothetical protein [Stratiformator vulcanicus]|uniref:Leucine Rich repeats (2 copies) n=1 Tax=Stratiformator vulcanicus TaxID=2527980 RepID=A0A517R3A9_9PLAN|nr:hypothetical protein [Stratiformator vulcanicus]QDT38327.1 Leucine Rich repeats (2 copies) [Stratiformator vulcanicus]